MRYEPAASFQRPSWNVAAKRPPRLMKPTSSHLSAGNSVKRPVAHATLGKILSRTEAVIAFPIPLLISMMGTSSAHPRRRIKVSGRMPCNLSISFVVSLRPKLVTKNPPCFVLVRVRVMHSCARHWLNFSLASTSTKMGSFSGLYPAFLAADVAWR